MSINSFNLLRIEQPAEFGRVLVLCNSKSGKAELGGECLQMDRRSELGTHTIAGSHVVNFGIRGKPNTNLDLTKKSPFARGTENDGNALI